MFSFYAMAMMQCVALEILSRSPEQTSLNPVISLRYNRIRHDHKLSSSADVMNID